MFLMVFNNKGYLDGIHSEFIKQSFINITDFTQEKLSFNSVFIDNKGSLYRGVGIKEDMPCCIYDNYSESELQIVLTELLVDCMNNIDTISDIDCFLYEKLCLNNK